jgi:uncharacterized protein
MATSRRKFIKTTGVVTLGFLGLQQFACNPNRSRNIKDFVDYGPLKDDPAGIFNLPERFSYRIISRKGERMADGFLSPGKHDAMATFPGRDGKVIIVRNHEVSPSDLANGPFGLNNELLGRINKNKVYDPGRGELPGLGGTTTMIYDEKTGEVEKEYLSLAGTIRNCAGGTTPWGSWITCEETVVKSGGFDGKLEMDHGYNFEVKASESIMLSNPVPLKAMGRFNHEAVAVDPSTGIVYQTEDRGDGLIYRYIPNVKGELEKGGKLQALAVMDQPGYDTRNWESSPPPKMKENEPLAVKWIDMEQIDSPEDDLRLRGFEAGAARFARGEGMWYGNDEVYFACTNGGLNGTGQIFKYKPSRFEGTDRENNRPGQLELFAEPNDTEIFKFCDNLTVAPWGDVVLVEDHNHPFIVGITPDGEYYRIGENVGYESELAGVVFSPSGKTLFVNIQHVGLTLAIEGPWLG